MRSLIILGSMVLATLVSSAQADTVYPLFLTGPMAGTIQAETEVMSPMLDISYKVASVGTGLNGVGIGQLTVVSHFLTGNLGVLQPLGDQIMISNEYFDLTATFNLSNGSIIGGGLTVSGSVASTGGLNIPTGQQTFYSSTDFVQFGEGTQRFDFQFGDNTGTILPTLNIYSLTTTGTIYAVSSLQTGAALQAPSFSLSGAGLGSATAGELLWNTENESGTNNTWAPTPTATTGGLVLLGLLGGGKLVRRRILPLS